jgi:hypothetical protein
MIQGFRWENGLPCFHCNNRRRAGVAFNDVRLYYSFQIELVPFLRSLLQHCIQLRRVGDDLAGCFGSSPRIPAKDYDWLTSDLDVNPGDYSVVARKALPRTCH